MADITNQLQAAAGATVALDTDPNFKQTVLLLHGDGTNGAQNNTFLDSSTNNFTITRNGNTTQGTFSPFSVGAGEWSNYFDGNDSLTVGPSATLALGSGDFTVESWIYLPSTSGAHTIATSRAVSGSSSLYWTFGVVNGKLEFQTRTSGGTQYYAYSDAGAIIAGQWYHVAATRKSNVLRVFVNGDVGPTTVNDGGNNLTEQYVAISLFNFPGFVSYFTGYISNFRIVKGTALYDSSFTISTAPLTSISNTSLLTCQSNRFVDNSTNAFAITRNGDVRVTPFSPFAPSAAYFASTNGGSGYFDGSGDWLSAASNAAFDCGTGNWTLEAWVYILSESNAYPIICGNANSSYATAGSLAFGNHNTDSAIYNNKFIITGRDNDSTGNNLRFADSTTHPLNTWIHIAVVRDSSTTLKMYRDGVLVASTSNIPSGYTFNWGLNGFRIGGGNWDGANRSEINAYVSNLRLIKGQFLTTGAFTPPTAPLQSGVVGWTGANVAASITGTEAIITNFTNAGIFDNTGKNNLETVGNAQIDTTTKKFGTGSMEFDGTGDYLLTPAKPEFYMGAGNYTLEAWINVASFGTSSQQLVFGSGSTSNDNLFLSLTATSIIIGNKVANTLAASTTINTGTWYHIAACRSGTTLKIYKDGIEVGTTTDSKTWLSDGTASVGVFAATLGLAFNGFIDDLRITKGVARYPTEPFPTKAFPDL